MNNQTGMLKNKTTKVTKTFTKIAMKTDKKNISKYLQKPW